VPQSASCVYVHLRTLEKAKTHNASPVVRPKLIVLLPVMSGPCLATLRNCIVTRPRASGTPKRQQCCNCVFSPAWRNTRLRHVVDSRDFSRECLDLVFEVAEEMEKVSPGSPESKQLEGYCMATLFYEPSTRTRLSFEAAMGKLGGVILSTESAGEFSSAAKGETLEGIVQLQLLCEQRWQLCACC